MRKLLMLMFVGLLSVSAGRAAWADLVLVTVTGAVAAPNRGARDDFSDALFTAHDVAFDKARTFTRLDLAALGQRDLTVAYETWARPAAVRGPRLADVLKAAGAPATGTVTVQALDGYAFTLPMDLVNSSPDMILAIESGGQPLPIGGRGPAWLVFPPGLLPDQTDDSGVVWAVFHLRVDGPAAQ
jgi:hypothetical protein